MRIWLVTLCLVFAAPRVAGVFSDFWLDEIWALDIVGRIATPLDVFTRVHFDTNHWLYSLYLWAIGPRDGWIAYRLPALAAGVATVPLMAALARREGARPAAIAWLLAGASFLLIEYSSEARGYAPAVFFALASFYSLGRYFDSGHAIWALAFNACSVLGLLSHLTFLFPFAGFLAWSLARGLERSIRPRATLRSLTECHALPVLAFLALYMVDVRHIHHGAGPEVGLAATLGRLAALVLGLPDTTALGVFALALCAGITAVGIWQKSAGSSRSWVFYAVTLLLAPASVVVARAGDFPYWTERHFLVCVPFLLLLLCSVLARLIGSGRVGRSIAFALLALYLAGNSIHTFDFLRFGRGHYREAVEYVFAHTSGKAVTIGSDHDFRTSMLLTYYSRYVPKGRELVYVSEDNWPREGPQWLIIHSLDGKHVPEPQFAFEGRVEYLLEKNFPFAGVSGFQWSLYARAPD